MCIKDEKWVVWFSLDFANEYKYLTVLTEEI